MEKIKLEVIGITKSQTQTGAFAIILEDAAGKRQLSILIGYNEAQSIAIAIEHIKPPRPLTHDLFKSFSDSFNINITEVIISRLSEGVFYSKLICHDGIREIEVDARTSDAIALALRFECPIYAYKPIMDAALNIESDEEEKNDESDVSHEVEEKEAIDENPLSEFDKYSVKELKDLLNEAIENELYERASKIRDEIKKRK